MAFCIIINIGKWLSRSPDWREWQLKVPTQASSLFIIEEFSISHALILSNSYIINHWWIGIMQMTVNNLFSWLYASHERSIFIFEMLLLTAKVWFGKSNRKPPDKRETETMENETIQRFTFYFQQVLYFIEDHLYHFCNIDVNLSFWFDIGIYLLKSYLLDLVTQFIVLDVNEKEDAVIWKTWQSDENIETVEVNKPDPSRFLKKRKVMSNLVFSMSAKSKKSTLAGSMELDTDSYLIAIDTCTSETICKHRELFVGEIKSCRNLHVQGVGGSIKASGYGSIKIRVTCDEGKRHDLIVHNVIYLPESPVNLLSPQKWSKGSNNPSGTGEITIDECLQYLPTPTVLCLF